MCICACVYVGMYVYVYVWGGVYKILTIYFLGTATSKVQAIFLWFLWVSADGGISLGSFQGKGTWVMP